MMNRKQLSQETLLAFCANAPSVGAAEGAIRTLIYTRSGGGGGAVLRQERSSETVGGLSVCLSIPSRQLTTADVVLRGNFIN